MNNLTAPERLQQYITKSRQDLEVYAGRPNASTAAIAAKNRNLAELSEIANTISISALALSEVWLKAEMFLAQVRTNAGVSSLIIEIQLQEQGTPAYLTLP